MAQLVKLFEPGRIGTMEVKNRIVMGAMGTWTATEEGYVTDRMIDYYAERAKGGTGLIITEFTMVSPKAPGGRGFLRIWDDKHIPGLRKLCDAVHQYGAKIVVQVGHHGLQMGNPVRRAGFHPEEIDVVAPTAMTYMLSGIPGREATKEDIDSIQEDFAQAARRAKEAGFDGVEIHGAHGKLVHQFLSPFFNKRTDEYGGSLENRARFACEIAQRMREKVGPDFTILIRINGDDGVEGGIDPEYAARQSQLFVEAGVNAIDVSALLDSYSRVIPTYLDPPCLFVHQAETVKKAVNVPVITVGKINVVQAERILQQGKADFVAFGRPLFADPMLPQKAKEGRLQDIRMCIYCSTCIHLPATLAKWQKLGWGLRCTVNPAMGREREFVIKPTVSPKKVMVIGGGLAGMEAARVLAERGHQVSLYERGDKLGGQWNIAAQQRWTKHYAGLTKDLAKGLGRAGVKVQLNKEVTPEFVRGESPDAVVVATGSAPRTLDVRGAHGDNVVQAIDVIQGRAKVGDRVVVIGGRLRGLEVALLLAEQGKKVSLVTRSSLGREMNQINYWALRDKLIEHDVPIYRNSPVFEITKRGVNLNSNNELLFLKADTVVLAVGHKSESRLVEQLQGSVPKIYEIGDCVEPRCAVDAMSEGAEVGRKI